MSSFAVRTFNNNHQLINSLWLIYKQFSLIVKHPVYLYIHAFIFIGRADKILFHEKSSQDPLEQVFGCQKQRGRSSDNPSVKEFCKNTQALRAVNSLCTSVTKGNCRGKRRASMTESHFQCNYCLREDILETVYSSKGQTLLHVYALTYDIIMCLKFRLYYTAL